MIVLHTYLELNQVTPSAKSIKSSLHFASLADKYGEDMCNLESTANG